jgi:Flp pilus assembly protein TadG
MGVTVTPKVRPSVWRHDGGSALVEGALIIPVLFILLYGVFEFSWYFYQQQLVSSGIRDAARYLARSPVICNSASPEWLAREAVARNLAASGGIEGTARVPGWTTRMITVSCTGVSNPIGPDGLRSYRGGPFIYVVTVSTRFTEASLGFFRLLHVAVPAITISHSERAIGPS